MTTLKDIFKFSSLDLNNLLISKDTGTWLDHSFEVSPIEFLSFAKEDLSENTKRGYLNALTNSKRAIDCQVDTIFNSIGILHDDLPQNVFDYISWYDAKEGKIDAAPKLKLLRAMGMAPTGLISKARTVRNKLEHYYQVPDLNTVKDTVELAELFIGTTQNKLRSFVEGFTVGNSMDMLNEHEQLDRCIDFKYDSEKAKFSICSYSPGVDEQEIQIESKDISYLHLIKLCMTLETDLDARSALHGLFEAIGLTIPLTALKVTVE
jgi:hypothetical protein